MIDFSGLTENLMPWFYFIYLTILLCDRSVRDDARCRSKVNTPPPPPPPPPQPAYTSLPLHPPQPTDTPPPPF